MYFEKIDFQQRETMKYPHFVWADSTITKCAKLLIYYYSNQNVYEGIFTTVDLAFLSGEEAFKYNFKDKWKVAFNIHYSLRYIP